MIIHFYFECAQLKMNNVSTSCGLKTEIISFVIKPAKLFNILKKKDFYKIWILSYFKRSARGDMIEMYEHFHSYATVTLSRVGNTTTT